MRLRIVGCLLAGLALGAGLSVGLRRVLSPFYWLPADAIHVYVVEGCHGSRTAVAELSGPEFADTIWVVPLEGHAVPFGRDACRPVLARLVARHAVLGWVPEAVACDWLAHDAAKLHDYKVAGYATVLTRGPRILEGEAETKAVFAAAGLSYAPSQSSFGVRPLR